MTSQAELVVRIVAKDEATPALTAVGQKMTQTADLSASEWRRAGTAMAHFGQAMTNVLLLTNLMPGSMGKAVNTTLLLVSTTINAVYAISQLKLAYDALAKTQRISIAFQSILNTLSGVGIAKVALAAGVGVAAYAGATALMNRSGGSGGNNITINNNGMGNMSDQQTRALARQVNQNLRDDQRLGR